jgi:hypothetical protein
VGRGFDRPRSLCRRSGFEEAADGSGRSEELTCCADELKIVVAYLQKEIRASRRNVGALKLSNLLQLDRFEEDLNISKVRLRTAPPSDSSRSTPTDPPPPKPAQLQNLRQQAKADLRPPAPGTRQNSQHLTTNKH